MIYTIDSLFDPRGGNLCAHRCEVCNEELDPESRVPTCADCNQGEEDDE